MNFFKKLFSSNKEETNENKINSESPQIKEIYRDDYFQNRFIETDIYENQSMIEGCMKMIESYYLDNKIEKIISSSVNHPVNLDQVVEEGMGFHRYCQSFGQEDSQIIFILAYAFAEFLIKENNFKLYKDNEPEFPLRSITLKLEVNGAVLSLYPFEYSLKVLNNEAKFESLFDKIKSQTQSMPNIKEDFMKNLNETIE
jgi:hypothetical protein